MDTDDLDSEISSIRAESPSPKPLISQPPTKQPTNPPASPYPPTPPSHPNKQPPLLARTATPLQIPTTNPHLPTTPTTMDRHLPPNPKHLDARANKPPPHRLLHNHLPLH